MNGVAVIPCYNCEITIGWVVKQCLRYLGEVVVVDDGSVDASAKVAKHAGARVLRLHENKGVGHALQSGFEEVKNKGFGFIVTLDADGAHDPSDIPNLLQSHRRGHHALTIGNRWRNNLAPFSIPDVKWWSN